MRNYFYFLLFIISISVYSQNNNEIIKKPTLIQEKATITVEDAEQMVQNYINENLNSFELPEQTLKMLKENIHKDEHHEEMDENEFTEFLIECKKMQLRSNFFQQNPAIKAIFEAPLQENQIQQLCANGGFEPVAGGNPNNLYVFRRRNINVPLTGQSVNIVTTGNDFIPFQIAANYNTVNQFNNFATLVNNQGPDPVVPTLPRVLNGTRAIKLNVSTNAGAFWGHHITTMSRQFVVNEDFFQFNYSLILQNPGGNHDPDEMPFFVVRLYDMTGNIIRQVSIISNPGDCMFKSQDIPNTQPGLFTEWVCDRIPTNDLIGQNIIVEFIVSDCFHAGHFGTVYIDDMCNFNCANPLNGAINLTNINNTINCPTTTINVCGTYTLPVQGAYGNISLNVLQGTTLVSTITAPTTLTPSTFCFNVPISAFGNNPNGNFEFQVVGDFIRNCTLTGPIDLLPITDNSAFDAGSDVVYSNCIDAVPDNFNVSSCSPQPFSVLTNDTVFGQQVTPSNVVITQVSPSIPELTFDTSTGVVTVAPGTSNGVYSLTYQICNINNLSHCDTATVNVTMTSPIVNAQNDNFTIPGIDGCFGGSTSSVITNDLLCSTNLISSEVTFSLVSPNSIPGATINSNGILTIPGGITPGNYTLQYTICLNSNPTNCDTAEVLITINQGVTPLFNIPNTLCYADTPPILHTTSLNGIAGNWSPAEVSNTATGIYTFTPIGQCAENISFTIGVIPTCGFTISWGSEVSCQTADGTKRWELNIADGPCLRVCENSIVTYELHGNLSQIDYTEWLVTGGTIVNETNTTVEISWNSSTTCHLQGTIYLLNGTQVLIDKCVEKLEAPNAAFGVFPSILGQTYTTCLNSPTYFVNYTTAAGGNDNLYYNWYFSDGTTSNEFEPVHYFSSPGLYQVTLVVYNGCSCVGKADAEILVEDGSIEISCPTVVCEGTPTTYSIDPEYASCQDLTWGVEGGTLLPQQGNSNQIGVVWNQVDSEGFGYVTVTTPSCSQCVSRVRVPVVTQTGTIKGDIQVCEKTQNTYSLPQWPSTDFNWSLNDNGTGAVLILDLQRNKIIVQSQSAGTIELFCSYTNTLLNCGGTAHLTIQVNTSLTIFGEEETCKLVPVSYEIQYQNGDPVVASNWTVTGPQSYTQSGTSNPLTITFPIAGVYYISAEDPNHCSLAPKKVIVTNGPGSPDAIMGPLVICPGSPATYSCSPPPGVTAHWSVVNGTIIGSSVGNSILVNFNQQANANFAVSLWYEKDECISSTLTITIDRDEPAMDVVLQENLVCGSSYATYSIATIDAEFYTWSIEPPTAGSISSGQNTHEISVLWNQQPQTALVKLLARKCGAEYTITPIPVTIITAPSITISGTNEICSGQNAQFSFTQNPSGFFSSVLWDFGDGTTFTSTSSNTATHQYQNPVTGTISYTVTATVSGGNGCLMNSIATFVIVVSPSPVIAISPVTNINLCPDLIFTPGDGTYSVTMQGGFASTDVITWFKNGVSLTSGSGSNAASINLLTYGVGTYYATVTNSFTCTATTQTIHAFIDCGECVAPEQLGLEVLNNGCQGIVGNVTALPAGYTSFSWIHNLSGATNIVSNTNYFSAETIAPGQYALAMQAYYNNGTETCVARQYKNFIIPYAADLKYQIACATSNTYTVTLLDFSTYYYNTAPTNYWFTLDGGTSWIAGTLVSGVQQITMNLSPGDYYVGIKIKHPDYDECIKYRTITVPSLPNAHFTSNPTVCINSPLSLTVTNPMPGYFYHWNFGDGSENLQQNPFKTYNTPGLNNITLTVSNIYGCSATFTRAVNVLASNNIAGTLIITPPNVCQGGQKEINYELAGGTLMPSLFTWYQNTVTPTPFAVTTAPNLTVTQNGQYFVYLQNANGCQVTTVNPITVAFTPVPATPVVTGNRIACINSPIKLKVPVNNTVVYEWSLNGVLQPQYANLSTLNVTHATSGIYVYSVVAKFLAGGTIYCSSQPGMIIVSVVADPNMPELAMTMISCEPYQVAVEVTNPQTDVGYYWSNGDTGSSTVMTHDGPLQVRAVLNECFVTTQVDMPIDLESMSWVFPKGCYNACGALTGTLLGPFGPYTAWAWMQNGEAVSDGSGDVAPLTNLQSNNSYSLYLANDYCEDTTGVLTTQTIDCSPCNYRIEVSNVICNQVGSQTVYQIVININNPSSQTAWSTFTSPTGQGYFSPSTLVLPPGNSIQTLTFIGQVGFNGGILTIDVSAVVGTKVCQQEFNVDLPGDCIAVEECQFGYKLGDVSCIRTGTGLIYHISIEITNPYAVSATTVLSVPNSMGTISPVSVTSPNGITMQHFYFYPNNGYFSLPVTITNTIGTVNCIKEFEIRLPEYCPPARRCNFTYQVNSIVCQQQTNGSYGYSISMAITNPYSVSATVTLTATNGEGVFVPATLSLPINPTSTVQSFVFYPSSWFLGGNVEVMIEGHYKDEICISYLRMRFNEPCCLTCRIKTPVDLNASGDNLLVIAPNPAGAQSTIFYTFVKPTGTKRIVLTDVLGRVLQEWTITDDLKGALEVNTSRYAQGSYLIMMQQEGEALKQIKMVKQ